MQQIERLAVVEDMPHRFPIHTGCFHRHLGHSALDQPLAELDELMFERAERAHLQHSFLATGPRCANARHDRLLVNIETGAPVDQHLHHNPLGLARGPVGAIN
jgi:hypothetical protein